MQAPKVDVSHLMDKSNRAYRLMRVYRAVRESAGRLCCSYYHYVGINEMIKYHFVDVNGMVQYFRDLNYFTNSNS